jgi:hypothetical protein
MIRSFIHGLAEFMALALLIATLIVWGALLTDWLEKMQ